MNAQDTYKKNRESVNEMMQRLTACLDAHSKRQAVDAANWGYIGDIEHVEMLIAQAVFSLGGMGEGEKETRGL